MVLYKSSIHMEIFIMSAYSKTGFFTKLVGVTFDNNNGSSRQQFLEELYDVFDINNKTFSANQTYKSFFCERVRIHSPHFSTKVDIHSTGKRTILFTWYAPSNCQQRMVRQTVCWKIHSGTTNNQKTPRSVYSF